MREQSTERLIESRLSWEDVEVFARQRIQTWFQRLLEEEVEELLGRTRYARRDGVDAPVGYRNGLGKPRRLTLSTGTITARRPRVGGWRSASRAASCRCSSAAPTPWVSCSRRSTSAVYVS